MLKNTNSRPFSPISLPAIPSSPTRSHLSSFTQTQLEDDPDYLHLLFLTFIGKVVIKCKLCESFFDNLPLFNIHVKKIHKFQHLCRVCYKVYYNKKQQKVHMREIHGKLFTCEYCTKKFWDYSGLKDHIKGNHHGMELPSASIRSDLNLYGTLVDFDMSDMDAIYTTIDMNVTDTSITDMNVTDTSITDMNVTDTIITDMTYTDMTITDTTDTIIDDITAAMTAATIVDLTTDPYTIDDMTSANTIIPGSASFRSGLFENQPSIIIDNNEKFDHKRIIKKKHDDNAVLIHEYVYDDDVMLKCKLCEDIFLSNKEFNKHAKTEHKIRYLCFSCSEVFQDKKLCRRHINKYHSTYCIYCVKRFNMDESLEKHILEFHSNPQEDSEVIYGFQKLNLDDDPREVNHEENINTTITNADDEFFLHETLQDNSGTIIKCKECEKTFECLTMFRYHARSEHNYEWLCSVCCLVFSSGSNRGKHMRKYHKKNFSCTLCIRKFYDKVGLIEHLHSKHRSEIPTPIPTTASVPSPPSPPPSSELQEETFIHEIIPYESPSNKEPPYQLKCKICEKIFKNHSLFNRHAKVIHNCEFLCAFCSQTFSQKRFKKKHVRLVHVYTCQICQKNLRSEYGLRKHLETQHDSYKQIADDSYEPIAARLRSSKRNNINNISPKDENNEMDKMDEDRDSFFNNYDIKEGSPREHYRETLPQTSIPSQTSSASQAVTAFIHETIPCEISYELKCKICEKIFGTHLQFNTHAEMAHNYKFLCSFCSRIFSKHSLKWIHERREHFVTCQVCGKKFRGENGLMSHFKAKHDQMNINSDRTETVYTSLPQLPQDSQLPGTSTFDEPISATPNNDEEMDMTLENEMDEDGDSFFDDYGVIDFTIFPQTSSASQTVTVQDKSFIHDIIPYNIPTNKIPPYQLKCRICKMTYKNHSKFNIHAKKKHKCKFLCSYCSKIFINKELGEEHRKRDHVSECQDCGRRFICEESLMNHCRDKKHHQNDNKINSRQEKTSYGPIAARLRSKDLDMNSVLCYEKVKSRKYDSIKEDEPEVSFKKFKMIDDNESIFLLKKEDDRMSIS